MSMLNYWNGQMLKWKNILRIVLSAVFVTPQDLYKYTLMSDLFSCQESVDFSLYLNCKKI